jgi:S1-C subfamily serine protease
MLSLLAGFVLGIPHRQDDAAAIYKEALPSVMTLLVRTKSGGEATATAFASLGNGLAVTCWHAVKDAKEVTVRFSDGEEAEATGLVDKDEKKDLALLRIRAVGKPLLALAPAIAVTGQPVFVIGAPRGLEFSVTSGIVSSIRQIEGYKQLQFSAAASPGNSGGPVLNAKGQVVGVVAWQLTDGQNLNFATAASYVGGLDASLPTTPWAKIESTAKPAVAPARVVADVAASLNTLWRLAVRLHIDTEEVMRIGAKPISPQLLEELVRARVDISQLQRYRGESGWDYFAASIAGTLSLTTSAADRLIECSNDRNSSEEVFTSRVRTFVATYRLTDLDAPTKSYLALSDTGEVRAVIGELLTTKLLASKTQKGWMPGEMDRTSRKRFDGGYLLLSRLALDVDSTGYVFGFLIDPENQARLIEVHGGTPPKSWGFQKDDVLQDIDGKAVTSFEQMKRELIAKPTWKAEVKVLRKGKTAVVKVDAQKYAP